MKFKEEVFAKIFTYITVIVLLGVLIFEAWSLQETRSERKAAEESLASAEESLQKMIGLNLDLKSKNEDLEAFQAEWSPYAAFVESKEVLSLKMDLFTRPELIPEEAIQAVTEQSKEPEENAVAFSFDNPDGEDVFLPLSTGIGDAETCLVYTVAFESEGSRLIELLYEIDFTKQRNVIEKDENGEMEWNCVAWQIGDGWHGIIQEKEEETE